MEHIIDMFALTIVILVGLCAAAALLAAFALWAYTAPPEALTALAFVGFLAALYRVAMAYVDGRY